MNNQEAAKLLSLIKLSYPTAYRDIDKATANATVNMWQMSFPDVPYPIMEQAFNHFRMVSKFPPTVAEIVDELRSIHSLATENALLCKSMDNEDGVRHYRAIMECTARYKDMDSFWGRLNGIDLPQGIGGRHDVQMLGTSRDNLD